MPDYEIRVMWAKAFLEFRNLCADATWRAQHPDAARFFPGVDDPLPVPTASRKRPPPRGDLPYRPISVNPEGDPEAPPESPEQIKSERDSADRYEFLLGVVRHLVNNGPGHCMRQLRQMGYRPSEVNELAKQARSLLVDQYEKASTEELRALSSARYDSIFRKAIQACDYRTGLHAQKQLDRLWGLTQEEQVGVLSELSAIVRLHSQRDPNILRLVQADAALAIPETIEATAEVSA